MFICLYFIFIYSRITTRGVLRQLFCLDLVNNPTSLCAFRCLPFLIPLRRVSNWSILIDGNHPRRSLTSSGSVYQRSEGRKPQNTPRLRVCGCHCPPSCALSHRCDHAAERAVPRRRQRRRRWTGLVEPRVAVPQPVPAQGVPDADEDHAGSGCLSDGPGEPHPGRQLRSPGSHHLTQGPTLVSVLGGFLGEYTIQSAHSR